MKDPTRQVDCAVTEASSNFSRQDFSLPSKDKPGSPTIGAALTLKETVLTLLSLRMKLLVPTHKQVNFWRHQTAIATYDLPGIGVERPPTVTFSAHPIASIDSAHSDSELDSRRESFATDEGFTNPLVSGKSVYIADLTGQPCEFCCAQML